jgi:dihydrofolate reductase
VPPLLTRIRRGEPALRAGVRYRPRPGADEAVHGPDCARGWSVSASAVREVHSVLSGAFKQAVVWGWTAHNPAKLATPPAAGRAEVSPPDLEAVARLLTAATEPDPELGPFLRLAVALGARRSELIALKRRDVDLGHGEVLIASGVVRVAGRPLIDKDTKTHAKRRVAVGASTVELLRAQRARQAEAALAAGTPLAPDAYLFSRYEGVATAHDTLIWGHPKAKESPVGKVVMYSSVSVDGFVADENDQPGPLFDWLSSGDVPLDESGELKVSQTSYDYTRPYWDQIGATVVGRHVFDMTDGWDGMPPGGIDHVVVVTHRPKPEGWDPDAPFHFVDGVEAAVAKAQELAGDRMVEVAAGDVGGQVLAAGLIDEVRMDVIPVVFGSGKRYFGSVHAQHLLEDPDVVIQGNRVLHLRYRVRR